MDEDGKEKDLLDCSFQVLQALQQQNLAEAGRFSRRMLELDPASSLANDVLAFLSAESNVQPGDVAPMQDNGVPGEEEDDDEEASETESDNDDPLWSRSAIMSRLESIEKEP
eukprot:NODE_6728_length_541_cov_22.518293_g6306_i0.p1 GENE.NODE_6728_length_541_cov_22.518293_g6306_i0~~NODE_6728_length_541_cov_22.518293_g6306_i0.p1  ORF type:complete len:112 (-),score=27.75 NODE_6728_length_541_cov_22.518293_g6306_i0:92-427(-)